MPDRDVAPVVTPHRWWALGAVAVSLLTVGLDLTILNIALPTLATDLHASTSQLQWFANAYTLVLAAGLLPAGLIGDQLGQKRLFLGALAVFGAASVGCAYAGSPTMLIVARMFLGVGAAFMIPLSISLLRVLFSDEERPKAIAVWTTATFAGIPLGPVLGGWMLDHFWWGSVFLINVPLVLAGSVVLAVLLPSTPGTGRAPVDLVGIVLSSTGLVAVTYGMTGAGYRGWVAAAIVPLIVGLALLAGFVVWLGRHAHPLVDLDLFRSAGFTSGSALATLASFAMMGTIFVLPQYFQAVWSADAFGTGLRLLPLIGGLVAGVQVSARLFPVLGAKVLVAAGFGAMACGLLVGATTEVGDGYGFVTAWLLAVGCGLGMALPLTMNASVGALSPERSGVGGGLVHALRQVGGTLGVAVLGTVLNAGYRSTVDTSELPVSAVNAVLDTAASGVEVARASGAPGLLDSVRHAFLAGMSAMFLVCAGFMFLAVLVALAFLPQRTGR